jgi:TetR/AcrR family transcriptional regulator, regulator of cefoperazone and chloramphenicol sensitivity
MAASRPTQPSGDSTPALLVQSALVLFGARSFDATSTRAIAASAGVNIASIAYHFGGKEGLRTASAEYVVRTLGAVLAPIVGDPHSAPPAALTQLNAEARLLQAIDAMIGFVVADAKAQAIARFVLREQMEQSPAFEILYATLFTPMHKRVCHIWAEATGASATSEDTRIATLSVLGQVIYFRIFRNVVMRRLDWADIGAAEAVEIGKVVKRNVAAAIEAARRQNHVA